MTKAEGGTGKLFGDSRVCRGIIAAVRFIRVRAQQIGRNSL